MIFGRREIWVQTTNKRMKVIKDYSNNKDDCISTHQR